jgi:NTE family protein
MRFHGHLGARLGRALVAALLLAGLANHPMAAPGSALAATASAANESAHDAPELQALPRTEGGPRIVLVLSGGGARGGAHIGVLRALEELRVPIHGVVGTSMGAVVGGLYAAGHSPVDLERLAAELDWVDLFEDDPARDAFSVRHKQQERKLLARAASGIDSEGIRLPQGYLRGHKLKALFTRQTLQVAGVDRFTDLPVPFAAVAADITSGEPVILDHGNLAESIFASMAIPALVTPQKINGRLLVDGGVANNLPVDVAIAMGANVVIAVDISSPLYDETQLTSLLTVTDQLTNLLTRKNTEAQIARLRPQDLLVLPVLGEVTSVDFSRMETVITAGYRAIQAQAEALAPLAVPAAQFDDYLASQRRPQPETIPVERIDVASDTAIDAERLKAQLGLEPGLLHVDDIDAAADRLYGLELFGEVPWRYRDGSLTLQPSRKSWGPNYLRFGFGLEDDFEGRNHYRLGLALTATEVNSAGGEWRSEAYLGDRPTLATEFHQPLGRTRAWYVRPGVGWRSFTRPVYDGDQRLADYQIRQTGAGLAAGHTFGTRRDAQIEFFGARGSRERLVGNPGAPGGDADSGWVALRLLHDDLDSVFFPRHGRAAGIHWQWSDESIGASAGYEAWSVDLTQALAIGPHSVVLSAEYDSVYEGAAPFHEAHTLGGFFRLSGLAVDERIGQHRALNRAAYYYRVGDAAILPIYLGASLEAGQVWPEREGIDLGELDVAGSLFVGIDSPIGPLYIGGGMAEGGNGSLYIFLGQPF